MFSPTNILLVAALWLAAILPSFSQISNDDCASATALQVSPDVICGFNTSLPGTTAGGTASGLGVCNPQSNDAWYRFVATGPAHYIRVFESYYSLYPWASANFSLEVYAGDCGSPQLQHVNCNSLSYGYDGIRFGDFTPGQTYYLRVAGPDGYDINFHICVGTPPGPQPANDACANAVALAVAPSEICATPVAGTTENATNSPTPPCNYCFPDEDVWYTFTATQANHIVTLSEVRGVVQNEISTLNVEAYSGTCGGLVSMNRTVAATDQGSLALSNLSTGLTYHLRVSRFVNNPEYPAAFKICVTTPPPPANDECAGALLILLNAGFGCNGQVSGSLYGATASGTDCQASTVNDVWYKFTATSTAHRFSVSQSGDAYGMEVYGGDCDNLASLTCTQVGTGLSLSNMIIGATYYLRVFSPTFQYFDFTACIVTLPPQPANADCAMATTLTSTPMPKCTAPTTGSTAGVISEETTNCFTGKDLWYSFTATHTTHVLRVSDVQQLFDYSAEWWIELYEGNDCDNLNFLNCYFNPSTVYLSQLTIGKTYRLRWGSAANSAHSFQICLSHFAPPANDECADARPLTVHGDLNCYYQTLGYTAGSTAGQPAGCLQNGTDVWYRFTAIQATHRVLVSNVQSLDESRSSPLAAELMAGTCGSLSSLYCWSSIADNPRTLHIGGLNPGQTYYLRFANNLDGPPMRFNVCVLTPPPPPANDPCTNATVLIPEPEGNCTQTFGGTEFASPTIGLPIPLNAEGDVWYTFTANQANHNLLLDNVHGNFDFYYGRAVVEVYASACGTFSKFFEQTIQQSGTGQLTNLTPGAAYHVRIFPADDENVRFSICINSPLPPSNDECANALPLPINTDPYCYNYLTANTSGATQSLPGCDGKADNDIWYTFTATDATYRFEVLNFYGDGSGGLEVMAGDCGQLASLACWEISATARIFQQSGFTPGTTYYLRVWNKPNLVRQWSICTRALPAPPANDDCANATPLVVNAALPCNAPTLGTTLSASASPLPGCAGYVVQDVWYTFVATSVSNLLEINVNRIYFGGTYAVGAELLSGDCGNGSRVFCEDYPNVLPQTVLPDLTIGETYYLRLYVYDFQANDFSVCLTALPTLPNDDCAQATPVVPNPDLKCSTVYPGSTVGASFEANFNEPDVWYTFAATSSTHLFQLLDIQTVFGYSGYLYYQIYKGGTCGNGELIDTFDPTVQTQITDLVPGETYFVRVFSYPYSAAAFNLCILTPPPPPANDECANALPLTPNTGLDCTVITHGSTVSTVVSTSLGCYATGNDFDVWYSFTATAPSHQVQALNIERVVGSSNDFLELAVFKGTDCVNLELITCAYFDQVMYLPGLTVGETYFVMASSRYGTTHEFDLCVTTYPVPANDLCTGAIALPVSATADCDSPTFGTTISTSPSLSSICDSNGDVWYTFAATATAHTITLSNVVKPIDGNAGFGGLEVYSGDCENLKHLTCRFGEYGDQFTMGDLVPGAQYWIRIGYGEANFNICITTPDALPTNDACTSAIALAVSPDETCTTLTSGTTERATPSLLEKQVNYGSPIAINDVWYRFTATQANHAVLLSNVSTWNGSLTIEIYTGACGNLTKLSAGRYYWSDQDQWLVTNLAPGETYYVRAFNETNYATTFDLCVISPLAPPNDECAGAISLTTNTNLICEQQTTSATYGATQSAPGCAGEVVNDVWFQFSATSTSCLLSISGNAYGPTPGFGAEVLEGTCTAPTVVLPCAEYGYSKDLLFNNLTLGKTYYLRLYVLPADLKVFTICLRNLPEPPANDDCAQATLIEASSGVDCDKTYTGTTLSSNGSAVSCDGNPTSDVWYQFVATSTAHIIEAKVTGYPLNTYTSAGMEVYAGGNCTNLTSLFCVEGYSEVFKIVPGLTVGDTYFVRIFNPKGEAHDFSLCIRTLPLTPANTTCEVAISIVPSPDMQCAQPVAGSTAGLTEMTYSQCYGDVTNLWYRFTATEYTHFIQFQNVAPQYGNAYFGWELYEGECPGFSQLMSCSNEPDMLVNNLTPGTEYYIRVVGRVESGTRFDLCVLTPSQPANDHCSGAVMLPVSPTHDCLAKTTGTTIGATGSYSPGGCTTGPDLWYTFVATNQTHTINISNKRPYVEVWSTFLEVLDGECNDWNQSLRCHIAESTTLSNLEPGKTYSVRIGVHHPAYLSFDICITTPQPDVFVYGVDTYSNGCKPSSNEQVNARFINWGEGAIYPGDAQFTLTVSGANSGIYSATNAATVPYGSNNILTFSGIDLSKPGESLITVTAVLPNDLNQDNNTQSITFTSLPLITYYRDADGDGYGDPTAPFETCYPTGGYVEDNTDCDDTANWINPGATEICNGYDDDCNGLIDAADPGLADAPPASITCPSDITAPNDAGVCSAKTDYAVSTSDNCGYTTTQTEGLASGTDFPVGSTLNTFIVSAPDGSTTSCSFTVTVQKTADPDLLYAYTVIGLNDVSMKKNTVQSGGVGVVNAGKKARLQLGTTVTAANTFVKAPVLELTGGSQATTSITGQVAAALLPTFQPNPTPSTNNLTIPNNSAPVTLALDSYGSVIVGLNTTVTFSGKSAVRIRELTLKEGAKVLFTQNTDLLINGIFAIGRNVDVNPSGTRTVQCFVGKNVTVSTGAEVWANIQTLADLRLEKANVNAPIQMTGLFIANNVSAEDFAYWNWDATRCPVTGQKPSVAERQEAATDVPPPALPRPLQIFPNPASEAAQVRFDLEKTDSEVLLQLLDATGHAVRTERWLGTPGSNTYRLPLGHLPEGMYVVQVLAEGQRWVEKLVVLRD